MTNIKTWAFASRKEMPTLQRGTVVRAFGYAGALQTFVVNDPEARTCVELRSIEDGFTFGSYFSPKHTLDKDVKFLKDKFGIGFYVDPDTPMVSEEDIVKAEQYADAWYIEDKRLKDEKTRKFAEDMDNVKRRYPYLKVNPAWSERIDNVRLFLKYEFSGIKTSVRQSTGAGCDSITISVYTNNEETVRDIQGSCKRFQGGYFDGMTDCYEYVETPFTKVFGSFKYVFAQSR